VNLDLLITDYILWTLVLLLGLFFYSTLRHKHQRAIWRQVLYKRLGRISIVVLSFYILIALSDSIHFQTSSDYKNEFIRPNSHISLLDIIVSPLQFHDERTYSKPFAYQSFVKEYTLSEKGHEVFFYPRLKHGGANLKSPEKDRTFDITASSTIGLIEGLSTGV